MPHEASRPSLANPTAAELMREEELGLEAPPIEARRDLAKLVRKLRWIGMDKEAEQLIRTLPSEAKGCFVVDSWSTD
jgi:hypothetical protein